MFPMEKTMRTSNNPIRNRFNQVINAEGSPIKEGASVPFESNWSRMDSRIVATSDDREVKKAQIKTRSVKRERRHGPTWRKIIDSPSDNDESSSSSTVSSSSDSEDEGTTPVNQLEIVMTPKPSEWGEGAEFVKKQGKNREVERPFFGHEQASWEEDPADQVTGLHLTQEVIDELVPESKLVDTVLEQKQPNADDEPLDDYHHLEEEVISTSKASSQSSDESDQEHNSFFEVDLPTAGKEPQEEQLQSVKDNVFDMEVPIVTDDQPTVMVEPVKLPDRLINPESHVVKKKWKFLKETEPLATPEVKEKGVNLMEIEHDEAVIQKSPKIKKEIKWRFLKEIDPLKKAKEPFEEEISITYARSSADPFINKILRNLSTAPMNPNSDKESKIPKNIVHKEPIAKLGLLDVDWNQIPPYRGPQETATVNVADFADLKYDALPDDHFGHDIANGKIEMEDDLVTVNYESDSETESYPEDERATDTSSQSTTIIPLANSTSTPLFLANVKSDVPNEAALFFDGDQQELPARRERPLPKPVEEVTPSKTKEVTSKLQSTLDKIKTKRSKKKNSATTTVTNNPITSHVTMGDKELKRSNGRIVMGSPKPPSVVGRAPIMMHRRNPGPLSPRRLDAVRRSSNRKTTTTTTSTSSETATSASFTVSTSTTTATFTRSSSTAPVTATTTATIPNDEDNGDGIFNGGGDVIIDDSGPSNSTTMSTSTTLTASTTASSGTRTSTMTSSSTTAVVSSSSSTSTTTSQSSSADSSSSLASASSDSSTTTSSSATSTASNIGSTGTVSSTSWTVTSSISSSSTSPTSTATSSTSSSASSSTASSTSAVSSTTSSSTSSASSTPSSSSSSSTSSSSTATSSKTSTTSSSSSSSSSSSKTTYSESTKTESTKTESTRNTGSSSFGQAQGHDETKVAIKPEQSYMMIAEYDAVPLTATGTDTDEQATSISVDSAEEPSIIVEMTETMQEVKEPTKTEEILEVAEIVTSPTLTEFIEQSQLVQSTGNRPSKNKKMTKKKETSTKKKPLKTKTTKKKPEVSIRKKNKKKQTKKNPTDPLKQSSATESRPEIGLNNAESATQDEPAQAQSPSQPRKIITRHPPKSPDDNLTEVDVEELDEKVILWDLPPDLMDDLSKSYLIEESPEFVWDVPFLAPHSAVLPPSKADLTPNENDHNVIVDGDDDDVDRSFIYQDGHWYEWDAKKKKK